MTELGYTEGGDDASQQQVSITPISNNNNGNKEESPNTKPDQTFDTLNTSAETTDSTSLLVTPMKSPIKDDTVQSLSPPTNNDDDTNTNIEESQNTRFTAPEAPRWRFAKKTGMVKGYSSRDAGVIIKGKSSQELGAQYTTPDISSEELIKPSERRKSDIELSKLKQLNYSMFEITRRKSDKMGPTDIKYSVFEKEEEEVGRLSASEKESSVLEVLEGGVVISHDKIDKEEQIDIGSRVWSNHHPRSTTGIDSSDYDKDEHTNLIDNDSTPDKKLKSVGKLNVAVVGGSMDEFEGDIQRRSQAYEQNDVQALSPPGTPTQNNASIEQTNSPTMKRKLWGIPLIPALYHANEDGKTVQTNDTGGSPVPPIVYTYNTGDDSRDIREEINDPNLNDKGDLSENNPVGDSRRKRRRLILLLLLLLLIVSAIIGAVLGKKKPSEGNRMSAVILAENTTDQVVPSSMPSTVPSYFGPGGSYNTGSVVVERPPWDDEEESDTINTEQIPWVDNEVVDSLVPIEGLTSPPTASPDSSIGSTTPQPSSKAPSDRPVSKSPTEQPSSNPVTESPTEQPTQQPVTQSPTSLPSKSPVKSSVVSSSQVTVNFFNPTQTPSNNPSKGPTNKPTSFPTTSMPSKAPTTLKPTPPLVEDGITTPPTPRPVTNAPSLFPTPRPSISPSTLPTDTPTDLPTPSPSLEPTPEPSLEPSLEPTTPLPTLNPTIQPSISTLEPTLPSCVANGNFNLCLAIDMSGSVCNGGQGGLCTNCDEDFNSCQDNGQNLSVCCNNFSNMLEFSQSLVQSLGDLPTKQDFSVVHFGTDVAVADTLENANQARKTIKALKYTGGMTNLAGAIDSCQSTLDDASLDRKNLMLILTDGLPSIPEDDPGNAAINAATRAMDKDTFIIPILLEASSQNSPEADFLRDAIASDRSLFLADFDSLIGLKDTVFEQVTCQASKPEQSRVE